MLTGYSVCVEVPDMPGAEGRTLVFDQVISDLQELRERIKFELPQAAELIDGHSLGIAINDRLVVASERNATVANGDRISLVPVLAGG